MEEKLLRFARTFCILLTVVISVVALSRTASIAGTTEGADWLYTQVQPDGSFALTDDISTAYQSTAEALRVFHTLGITSPADASAKQFLANEPFQNTEYLARRLIAESDAGSTVSLTLNELLARQNIDGGWGDLAGYDSTVLDTAFALEALGHVGFLGNEVGSALYYLSSTQQADGGWSDGVNASSVYTTAQILAAMGNYQGFYVLNAEIAAAQNYVSSQQVAGNLWNETFQSALALIGLISTTDDLTGLSAQVSALRAAQLADGSWEGKVYATALAVRALKLSEASPMNPGLASITGILVDGQTGLPLASVTVDVTGPDNRQVVSGSNGVFAIHDLIGGSYTLVFSLANYNSVTATTTVGAQQNVNFGTIQLLQGANATTGTIRGTVTDSANGQGLSGVTLTVSTVPAPVQTDANGNFQISNVPTGALTIVADKSGYSSATGSANMTAGGLLVFSPRLTSVTAPTTAIQGTVTDGNTGQPLSEVAISVTGSSTASAVTDAQGAYRIDNLVPGIITVEASLAGYDSATAITSIALNTLVNFSPALYPTNTTPPGSNTAGVRGVVLDSTTNQPLAGVSVVATFGTVTQSQTTGADGIFELAGFTETVGIAQFSLAGFTDVTIALNLTLLEVLDIGQVRLRPEGVVSLLPDLIVQNIDTLGASNDPDTLAMTGSIDVEVTNQGTSSVPASIALVAFYDANQSGQYEAGIDTLLGERTTTSAIDVGGSENVTINVEGTLLYRDAPIRVFVDSAQTIIESNEANNVATSASACEVQPDIGTFEPVLKWEWSGSSVLPTFDQVLTTPLVIQASDDNADGNINTDDMPDIAFISYPNTNTNGIRVNGVLTIVSGDDGSELVTVTNLQYSLNGYGNLAAADIDNDGIVEIIGPRSTIAGGGVIVFDHNGDVKWVNTQTGVLGVGGASVADLDADGSPEIIAGNSVLNSDGTIKWQWTGYVGGIDSVLRGGIPLAADINLDGEQEVVVGASAYSSTGQLLWVNETVGDGFGGLG
ncbi:MAG TPA: carboxypeptidase regulatory-like domain-containing protein, partial [Gammaproteobacteria bacterium]|nr:carboxypeptidase regulatory-like domain-containing protein [Gammaproteobacteria bacterium]